MGVGMVGWGDWNPESSQTNCFTFNSFTELSNGANVTSWFPKCVASIHRLLHCFVRMTITISWLKSLYLAWTIIVWLTSLYHLARASPPDLLTLAHKESTEGVWLKMEGTVQSAMSARLDHHCMDHKSIFSQSVYPTRTYWLWVTKRVLKASGSKWKVPTSLQWVRAIEVVSFTGTSAREPLPW